GQVTEIRDNEGKSRALYNSFFPPPPADHGVPLGYEYPPPKFEYRPITNAQILRAIDKLHPYKAPGVDETSNSVFTHCKQFLVPHMGPIIRATFQLEHYPHEWQISETVALRKPGKPDYSAPKAFRPIALLNSFAKIASSCVAEDLTIAAEELGMLPPNHFGG
ncbi:hypothetical protein PLICRDRAFT_83129, partial [Plicaturopsis crispa FD-325 SS-3]